jgi:hypothetical protein
VSGMAQKAGVETADVSGAIDQNPHAPETSSKGHENDATG